MHRSVDAMNAACRAAGFIYVALDLDGSAIGDWDRVLVRAPRERVAAELVLAPFLDDTLAEPFRSRARLPPAVVSSP